MKNSSEIELINKLWSLNLGSKLIAFLLTFSVIGLLGCSQRGDESKGKEDVLLVKIQHKSLYLSELQGMIQPNTGEQDSILLLNSFVERWARETALMLEAEKSVPQDLNIDQLVRDYRASLIKNNYERTLVEQLLDSTVTHTELESFYAKSLEGFKLKQPILQCVIVVLPLKALDVEEFKQKWKKFVKKGEDLVYLKTYCEKNAAYFHFDENTWFEFSQVKSKFPPQTITLKNYKSKNDFSTEDEIYLYFFKKIESFDTNEIPPKNYIEPKAKRIILHERKLRILKEKKEEIYERELRRNNVKFFIK